MNKKATAAIVLCAGRGTRMNEDSTNKVCLPCGGIPVILRLVNNLKAAGIDKFVIVVGHHAQKVMECLSEVNGVVYAYQPVQNGTGGAALCGLKALESMDFTGPVLIAMGDKITSPDVIRSMTEKKSCCEAVWGVQPRELNENGGRIVIKEGCVFGIVEKPDSALLALGSVRVKNRQAFESALDGFGLNEKKKAKVIEKALQTDDLPRIVMLNGEIFTSEEIEQSRYTNSGLYCFDLKDALEAIGDIKAKNAQDEIYLTDAIAYFAGRKAVKLLAITRKEQMMTYSTKEELAELDVYFSYSDRIRDLKPASVWIRNIAARTDETKEKFTALYGDDAVLIEERKNAYIDLLESFIGTFGDKNIVIARAPGRINLMGRHIDHRGGGVNMMAVNCETLLAAAPRSDDLVNISDTDKTYKNYSFSISECLEGYDCSGENGMDDWLRYIESVGTCSAVAKTKGEWINYVKSAVLRYQFSSGKKLLGMDIMLSGNIPVAAGLSSSSSIVVAVSEAVVYLNHLEISEKQFIDFCGEGEWFSGSRGGAGDHAAMKCCRRGMVTHFDFLPFESGESVPFSPEYRMIAANSFVESKKSESAKDTFNQRVASYEFGMMMVRQKHPEITLFRDLAVLSDREIYTLLLELPEQITTDELKERLPDYIGRIEHIQSSHDIPEYYELRSVVLYGISEWLRSEKCMDALKSADYELLGKLMNISHNGDRISGAGKVYDYHTGDTYIKGLMPEGTPVYLQPGGYACSVKEIDDLADMVSVLDGVMGAEIVGAGLGGCLVILVRKAAAVGILRYLKTYYYDKHGLPMGAQEYFPCSGSSVWH